MNRESRLKINKRDQIQVNFNLILLYSLNQKSCPILKTPIQTENK